MLSLEDRSEVTVIPGMVIGLSGGITDSSKDVGKSWWVLESEIKRNWGLETLNFATVTATKLENPTRIYKRRRTNKRRWIGFEREGVMQSWVINVWEHWVICWRNKVLNKRRDRTCWNTTVDKKKRVADPPTNTGMGQLEKKTGYMRAVCWRKSERWEPRDQIPVPQLIKSPRDIKG